MLLDRTPIPGEKGGKGFGGYAGLSVRMAKATRGWQFVDSKGRKDKEAHGKRARWVDFSGEIGGDKAAGVTIFDHPDNLRHPSPWYVEKGMPYFSPAVLFDKAYTLAAGKSLTLRYRILIHPGRADNDLLESEWKKFSALKHQTVAREFEKLIPVLKRLWQLQNRAESAKKLQRLGKALFVYADDHQGKFSNALQQLLTSGLSAEDLEWLLENVVYLGKGKTTADRPNTVLAYDKILLAEGEGTNVLFMDSYVGFERLKRLKKLGIKPAQETDVQLNIEKNR